MSDDIRLDGKELALAKLAALGRLDEVKAGLMAAGIYLQKRLATYPPTKRLTRESVYGQTFQTDRQRRGYFAKLRDGEIQVPYHRGESPGSQRLKASWTQRTTNGGMTVILGNDTTYGPLLMEGRTQSLFMQRLGWKTTDEIVDAERDEVLRIIGDVIDDSLED